jgi:hypothetical protein
VDVLEKETTFVPAGTRAPDRPVSSLVTVLTALSHNL